MSLHDEVRPFAVEVRPERDRVVVAPVGELDMSTTGALEAEIRELAGRGFAQVVVDLRGLAFMDSTGLRLLLELHEQLGAERFALIDGGTPVRRLLDLTGMRAHLRFVS